MKCVILAAGYATRMYPLTKNFPKPLLPIGNSTILDRILDDLETIDALKEIVIVSNHKFFDIFKDWSERTVNSSTGNNRRFKISLIDDGSVDNEHRLGAVGDLQLAIDTFNLDEDLLVLAGDNLLDFSLSTFTDFALSKDASSIMYHKEASLQKLQKTGVIVIGEQDKILDMEEKPVNPKSDNAVPPFYYYKGEDLSLIKECIEEGCKLDAPGNLLMNMCQKTNVYAFLMPGKRVDVGCLEDYERLKEG